MITVTITLAKFSYYLKGGWIQESKNLESQIKTL
jgi:hypothetical protein